jgi:hypothetical protein
MRDADHNRCGKIFCRTLWTITSSSKSEENWQPLTSLKFIKNEVPIQPPFLLTDFSHEISELFCFKEAKKVEVVKK